MKVKRDFNVKKEEKILGIFNIFYLDMRWE